MVPRVEPRLIPPPTPRAQSSNSTKHSTRSYSSSFEADDERSSTADHESMGPESGAGYRDEPSQYEGEDTRLTSRKELSGWYAYAFAAEVFVICGMGSFIPITLEQLASENGVLLKDRKTPCSAANRAPGLPGASKDDGPCIVNVGGWIEINTASFAMYTFSLSVLFQAILVVSISCAADHGNYRKRLLLFFAFSGAVATMLFLAVVPKIYLFGALLAMISNTCFGASFVLLNSFLPLLVRHHPRTQYLSPEATPDLRSTHIGQQPPEDSLSRSDDSLSINSNAALLDVPDAISPKPPAESLTSVELQLATEISSKGIGIGYSAGLFLQCMCILVVFAMGSSTLSLRVALFLVGAWWFVFTFPAAMWLRPRPGPPLRSMNPNDPSSTRSWFAYFTYAWSSLWRTVKLARRLKDIVLFLAAWFLLSDAIATVSGTAVLYAKTTLQMKAPALGLINVIATTAGVIGAFSWAAISRGLKLKPHQTIMACIFLFEIIPLYGLLSYIPFVKRWGVIGLQQPWEMYPLGFVYGFVLGGLSSYCRALFGELIPPGSEAAFYALYAITDKGSSIFGPAIVGIIVDRTGSIRPAFWFLAVLVGLPAPILYFVDVDRGKEEGTKLAEVLEGRRREESGLSTPHQDEDDREDRALLASDDEEDEERRHQD
ncbi:MFS general substrate transporter [Glarea lozoyensis ATCC 20868]|uniref:Autophagy-related protein n=1 Tax=Glarea lozoyensis (strain ATCC 20868 / MF5171) TaxID=1116229 RepID=S3DCC3_GLAL2|nr:MFS general substrate transporter [Glarea lozoyensis ATCC 20868]EPE29661.1 MFS general substrate transporter [Glarea lozoyensis ATCC 20868]